MSELPPEQPPTTAEQRLLLLLEAFRREAAGDDRAFVGSVMRHVRVQGLLRELLAAFGGLTSAAREALALVLTSRSGGRRDAGS